MGLYVLKFPYRKVLLPAAKKLKFIHPDVISYAAVLLTFFTAYCYLEAGKNPVLLVWAVVTILLRMTLNTIDGVIAIERGNLTLKGEIVNALPDRYSDILVIMGISFSSLCDIRIGMFALASVFLVSYSGMLAKAIGVRWQHQGPLGKVERLLLLIVFTVVQYVMLKKGTPGFSIAGHSLTFLEANMLLYVALGQVAVYNRVRGTLREAARFEWLRDEKYRETGDDIFVLYDSQTGNTEKVAREIAGCLKCGISSVNDNPSAADHELVIFCSPDIRGKPTARMIDFVRKNRVIKEYAVFITYGMPVWGKISARMCFSFFETLLRGKPLGASACRGYHKKYRTYKGHPDENDLLDASLFAIRLAEKLAAGKGAQE